MKNHKQKQGVSVKPPKSTPVSNERIKEISNTDVESFVDTAMVSLFNTMMVSVGSSFSFDTNHVDVTRFRSIVSDWAPQMYESNLDTRTFCFKYTFSQFFDKFISVKETYEDLPTLQAKAALKFLSINAEGLNHDDYTFSDPSLITLLDKMRYTVGQVLDDFNLAEIYKHCKHGPNSTSTIDFSDAYLDVKDLDWSGTAASLQQFIHYLHSYDTNLKDMFVEHDDELRSQINAYHIDYSSVVDYTDLSLVPKKFDSLRTMCPEPTIPAFHSQGVGSCMAEKLLKVNIDLKTQPSVHQMLAMLGSLYPELNIMTIDWSGASDRIWIALCRAVMTEGAAPKWFSYIMNVCRTTHTRVSFKGCFGAKDDFADVDALRKALTNKCESYVLVQRKAKGKSKKIYYECRVRTRTTMIGTMGNAITFPLQTLLFYAFLDACNQLAHDRIVKTDPTIRPRDLTLQCVSSYGDDGITDTRSFPEILHYAPLLGWVINNDKTFGEGSFRESCGGDYYRGVETRALMLQRPPTKPFYTPKRNIKIVQAWLYIAVNAANEVLERFGVGVYHTDRWLIEQHDRLKLGKVCVVPPFYPEGSGLRVGDLIGPMYEDEVHLDPGTPTWGVNGIGIGLDVDKFHVPWFSAVTTSYVFYCLSSHPKERTPLQEYSYYCRSLRGTPIDDYTQDAERHLSFFERAYKTAVLQVDKGKVKIKECRLHKTASDSLLWEKRYTEISNDA
jgi:hypothetical protein